jgi:hypothetical protein
VCADPDPTQAAGVTGVLAARRIRLRISRRPTERCSSRGSPATGCVEQHVEGPVDGDLVVVRPSDRPWFGESCPPVARMRRTSAACSWNRSSRSAVRARVFHMSLRGSASIWPRSQAETEVVVDEEVDPAARSSGCAFARAMPTMSSAVDASGQRHPMARAPGTPAEAIHSWRTADPSGRAEPTPPRPGGRRPRRHPGSARPPPRRCRWGLWRLRISHRVARSPSLLVTAAWRSSSRGVELGVERDDLVPLVVEVVDAPRREVGARDLGIDAAVSSPRRSVIEMPARFTSRFVSWVATSSRRSGCEVSASGNGSVIAAGT